MATNIADPAPVYTLPALLKESQAIDYIIVGGGTAGLTLAARLSEDPDVQVVVLEAGPAKLNDEAVMTPAMFPTIISNPDYDWMMKTVPQNGLNGKTAQFPRGKLLGGSSAMNFMMYARPQKAELDMWVKLGNEGWGWDDMTPYFQKSEGMEEPKVDGPQKLLKRVEFAPEHHGHAGPIHTSFTPFQYPLEAAWIEAAQKVIGKVDAPKDAWSGNNLGIFHSLCTVDRSNNLGTRSYAASAYYDPNKNRPNLKVVTNVLVSKVVLDGAQPEPRASGVQVIHGGEEFTIECRREVILCAGTVKSSQILELSGIGNPVILAAAGVDVIVQNDFVGENLQDHVTGGVVHEIVDGEFSMDQLQNPEKLAAAVQKYGSMEGGPLSTAFGAMGFASYGDLVSEDDLANFTKDVEAWNKNSDPRFLAERMLQLELLKTKKAGTFQFLHIPCNLNINRIDDQKALFAQDPAGTHRTSLACCLQTPFSRGSSHIISSLPEEQPAIDPAYLNDPADVKLLVKGLQVAREICEADPLASKLKMQVQPPHDLDIMDMSITEKHIRENVVTEYHPIGTASLGLVVDSRLRVKGTLGLRVCDASIFPSCVSGNTQSVVYAIAEKGAIMIKEDSHSVKVR